MSISFVRWHKHKDLEQIADHIHKKLDCSVPIDIDYIIEMAGLDIMEVSRLKEDFGLYGLLGKIGDRFTIFIQRGDFKVTNYNTTYTLAEELAHYILHSDHFKNTTSVDDAYSFYIKIKQKSEMMMELNAKHLASAILLPRGDLKKKAIQCYKNNREILRELLKDDCDGIITVIASTLTDTYRVPEGVISYRLKAKVIGFKDFLKKDLK